MTNNGQRDDLDLDLDLGSVRRHGSGSELSAPIEAPGPVVSAQGNGRRAEPASSTPVPASIPGLDEVEWHASYDRESVDRFLAEVEAEKVGLIAKIAAAEAREAKASERLAAQKAYNEDQLGALVVSARTELDRMEQEHADAVKAIRAEALDKAARILESARHEASAVGDASASLARVVPPPAEARGAHPSAGAGGPDPDPEERIDVG